MVKYTVAYSLYIVGCNGAPTKRVGRCAGNAGVGDISVAITGSDGSVGGEAICDAGRTASIGRWKGSPFYCAFVLGKFLMCLTKK